MGDGIDDINRQIKQGDLVITDEKFLNDKTEKEKNVDAITSPTMATLFSTMSRKFLEEKNRKLKE